MLREAVLAGLGVLLVFAGWACASGEDDPAATATEDPSVEVATETADTPTPTPPPPAENGYRLARTLELASFELMLGFSVIPGADDEAVVVSQHGQIWRVALEGDVPPVVFGDVSDRLVRDPGLEEGLLGLAFSPDFASDGRVFLYYSAGEPRRSVLSWFPVLNGAMNAAEEHVVLEVLQPYENHNGGQIAFGPDGYLYVTLGDGGLAADPQLNGQDRSTLLGSILRLDVSGDGYEIPPDNPFVDTPGARPEIYAYGFRNPWRLSFDRETGDMWAGDVGQDTWEEIDRVVAAGNYGWSILEGLECFQSAGCSTQGLQMPRWVYGRDDGCSVTGGYVYRGSAMPELVGHYVFGDYCSGRIWAVDTTDDSPPVLLADTGLPIASFAELPDGEILALTFWYAILRLERAT
jgi:glucose/arabinose dehydrogenase